MKEITLNNFYMTFLCDAIFVFSFGLFFVRTLMCIRIRVNFHFQRPGRERVEAEGGGGGECVVDDD